MRSYRVYHYDYRGSTIALIDKSGNLTDTFVYGAYGELIEQRANTKTIFTYVSIYGVQTDENSLVYMRNRYYNQQVRRFVNIDPIRDGINWYGYIGGNTINFIDPFGLLPKLQRSS